jgi:RND family efflux transporter MFP subunit
MIAYGKSLTITNMRKRTILAVAVLSLVILLCTFLFLRHAKNAEPDSVPGALPAASVAPVTKGEISSELRVAGQFTPYQEVDLHAKVSGYIRRINVDIGDRVRSGQVIAILEVPELEAQVAGAQAEVRHSQSEIARSKSEVSRAESNYVAIHAAYTRLKQASEQRPGLVAQQELDDAFARDQNAEAQINVAKSALEATEQQLGVSEADNLRVRTLSEYSVVVSPFNGVITRRYADTGSLIQAGTASNTQAMPVVRVAQSDLLRLRMPVPEADVRFIRDGGFVKVTVQALARVFSAKVVRFTRALDSSTRTMVVEVDVPNNDLSLSPGMYADTEIILQRHENALSIPTQAIVQTSGSPYILAVDTANRVEKKNVQVGIQGGNRTEIIAGLSAGDLIITSGQTNYQIGAKVRPQTVSDSSSSSTEATQ